MKDYYVYILASKKNGVLYTGVSSDLINRVYEHKQGFVSSFTKKYNVTKLVYYEVGQDSYAAITREKQIKKWRRSWKIELTEKMNPAWRDLYLDFDV